MLIRRLVFRPIGLVGCVIFAHGVHGLLVRAECGQLLSECGTSQAYPAEIFIGMVMALIGLIFSGVFVIGALLFATGIGMVMAGNDTGATKGARDLGLYIGNGLVLAGVAVSAVAGWAYWLRWTRTVRARASAPVVATVTREEPTPRQINYTVAHRGIFEQNRAEGAEHRAATLNGIPTPGLSIRRMLRGTAMLFDPVDHSEYRVVPATQTTPAAAAAGAAAAGAAAAGATAASADSDADLIDGLERLAKLHETGGLTQAEYSRLKEKLLRR